MLGLALEGGGARGAYHIGIVQALMENGYEFDGFVGTSIGAINAAILAQGDFDKAMELWLNISMEQIFDVDEQLLLRLLNLNDLKFDITLPSGIKKAITKIIGGRGINTAKMKAFLEQYICEDTIRESGKDFGLVTVSVHERKPYELMLEEIPHGSLISYIMASASFPGFQPETIEEKTFLDGGLYNNCPINLLDAKGYDEIIAVRTQAPGVLRKVESSASIKVIMPREDLGSILLFAPENSRASIKLGYYDGLRFIHGLRGGSYYIRPGDAEDFCAMLASLDDAVILKAGQLLNIPAMPAKRMLFEKIIPQISRYLKLDKEFDYADFVLALLEFAATQKKIEKYQIYDFNQLHSLVKDTPALEKEKILPEIISVNNLFSKNKIATELLIEGLLGRV